MKKGICCAGNMIVDITYPIETWPKQNELTHITEGIQSTIGGAVCNVLKDLAALDPKLHLMASGIVGNDAEGQFMMEEMSKSPNIDMSMVRRNGRTSFTAVMSNNQTKERTFFQYAGASALYGEDYIEWDKLDVDIFHIGYIFLLPYLDQEDEQYGTQMAKLLHHAQEHGLKTSLDVVSETGDRFRKLIWPALKYTDYCIINELEAQQSTGIQLRDEKGILHPENMENALYRLKELGVSTWAVIHCPELGCGLDEQNQYYELPSLQLPKDWIKGTVGAGDAFCAGVLYAAEKNLGMEQGLKLGGCAAAASLSQPGATEGMGSLEQVMNLWENYHC